MPRPAWERVDSVAAAASRSSGHEDVKFKFNFDAESAQMPKMGMSWEMAHCRDLMVSLHCDGSPGPLLQKRPSHLRLALCRA